MYATLVRDKAWRGSAFHLVFRGGEAYVDFKGDVMDPASFVTSCMSFDGAGCLSSAHIKVPHEIAAECLHHVMSEKATFDIPEDSYLTKRIQEFFTSNMSSIPDEWHEDFVGCGVIPK